MQTYEIHELADCLPSMPEDEFQALKNDISGLGVLEPIILLEGKILDGRHRYRACQELGIECPVRVMTDASPGDIVMSLNVFRRHLTASQRAMIGAKVREVYGAFARRKMEEHWLAGRDKEGKPIHASSAGLKLVQPTEPSARVKEVIAKQVKVSHATMQDALTVTKHGTKDQQRAVIDGRKAVSAVATEVRDERREALSVAPEIAKPAATTTPTPGAAKQPCSPMNRTNDNIGWAAYSWNPVTGCKLGCPYCYAKEIHDRYFAASGLFNEPVFHADRLGQPAATRPKAGDPNNRVFVGSMGELFGDWVPTDWTQQVLDICTANPQWLFVFLTKNPKRLPEFTFPTNAWIGATIDTQARVEPTAAAFSRMPHNAHLFVSCEPLLEPVRLSDTLLTNLGLVIVGALSKGATKEQPPAAWIEGLLRQARGAGAAVWFKDNLVFRPQEEIAK